MIAVSGKRQLEMESGRWGQALSQIEELLRMLDNQSTSELRSCGDYRSLGTRGARGGRRGSESRRGSELRSCGRLRS
ncbi:hypothetical protein FCM35_KLT03970 [Carex littledalei]|uniref:Uncharacterized protein n=1 Tax=Carex littledalei TaxID=544730 RepID=A0A833QZT6_9POAL|nr:hypothetical protein FCM35_KLT03970 [Carex littledalei]